MLLYRLAELPGPPLPDLRDVIAAGEQLRITPAVVRFFSRDTPATLHNQYGPTETTVITHSHTLTGAPESWPLLPPLGHTIEGVKPLLLDADRQPVPPGQPGELYFGGRVGFARLSARSRTHGRGVFARPGRSVRAHLQKRRPGPTEPRRNVAIPRSGRRSGEGARIPHRTRRDRGGARPPSRHRAGRRRAPANRRPAATANWWRATSLRAVDGCADRRPRCAAGCATQLPDYFVPARFAALERLPVTPSGKLDRTALVAACQEESRARDRICRPRPGPPRRPKHAIAQVWRQALGRGSIGVDDNFFDAGGNSISRGAGPRADRARRWAPSFPSPRFSSVRRFARWPRTRPTRGKSGDVRNGRRCPGAGAAAATGVRPARGASARRR